MKHEFRWATCTKDCYGACVYKSYWNSTSDITKVSDRCIRVEPSKSHPFTAGFFCSKYSDRLNFVYSTQRTTSFLKRMGPKGQNSFVSIPSSQAFDEISELYCKVLEKFGPQSVAGIGNAGNSGYLAMNYPKRFFQSVGAITFQGGICNEGGCAGLEQLLGTYSLTNPFQILSPATKLIILWESDLENNNNHAFIWVRKAQKAGVKLVVIDHRKTSIAQKADIFIQPHPKTLQFIALWLIKRVLDDNQQDLSFLQKHHGDWEYLTRSLLKFSYKQLEERSGVNMDGMSSLWNNFRQNLHHTLMMVGFGIQKDRYGGAYVQLIGTLQALLGNLGKPGTGLIYSQSQFPLDFRQKLHDQLFQDIPEKKDEYYLIELQKALKEKEIKLLFIYGFNPASSLPDQAELRNVLNDQDLKIICIDPFLTETTEYADWVIPPKMEFETNDWVLSYYIPGISINQSGPCPYSDPIDIVSFFNQLFEKISNKIMSSCSLEEEYRQRLFKMIPLFQDSSNKWLSGFKSLLSKIARKNLESNGYTLFVDPHTTLYPNGVPEWFTIDFHAIHFQELFDGPKDEGILELGSNWSAFLLLTSNHPNLLHSQLGNENTLQDYRFIFLHPTDIAQQGFQEGDRVQIRNAYASGYKEIKANCTLKPGSVLIYSGGNLLSTKKDQIKNANFFTSPKPELLGKSGAYNSSLIYLRKPRS